MISCVFVSSLKSNVILLLLMFSCWIVSKFEIFMSYNRHEILGYIQCYFPLYSFQKVSNAYENTSETCFFLNRCFLYTNKSNVSSYKVKKKRLDSKLHSAFGVLSRNGLWLSWVRSENIGLVYSGWSCIWVHFPQSVWPQAVITARSMMATAWHRWMAWDVTFCSDVGSFVESGY